MSRPSSSLREFRNGMRMVDVLLRLERGYSDPPVPEDRFAVEGLRGAAAVLMVAAFESYLRSVIAEALGILTANEAHTDFTRLPSPIRVANTFGILESALRGEPDESKVHRIPSIQAACQRVISDTIEPSAFADTLTGPGPDQTKALFRLIGIKNVFNYMRPLFGVEWRKQVPAAFIRDKLAEIVSRRHTVAHTASALNIARSDLREATLFLRAFARVLDRKLFCYVRLLVRTFRQ